jgi:hypothetical protein
MFCDSCGNSLLGSSRFCPNCGAPVNQSASVPEAGGSPKPAEAKRVRPGGSAPPPPSKRNRMAFWWAMGSLGLIIIILAIGLPLILGGGDEPTSTTLIAATSTSELGTTGGSTSTTGGSTSDGSGDGSSEQKVEVPNLVGMASEDALGKLRDCGLICVVRSVPDLADSGPLVVAQDPTAGTKVSKGSTVALDVWRRAYRLEDLVGKTWEYVRNYVRDIGIEIPKWEWVQGSTNDLGKVVAQDPGPGTVVMETSPAITVSIGTRTLPFEWGEVVAGGSNPDTATRDWLYLEEGTYEITLEITPDLNDDSPGQRAQLWFYHNVLSPESGRHYDTGWVADTLGTRQYTYTLDDPHSIYAVKIQTECCFHYSVRITKR